MADNIYISTPSTLVATDEVNINGSAAHVQYMKLVDGTNNSNYVISGDSTYGLDVDVTRIGSQAWPFTGQVSVSGNNLYVRLQDGSATNLTSTLVGGKQSLDVNVVQGGGGGIQYQEGSTASVATGTVMFGESPSNLMNPIQLNASNRILISGDVNIMGGGASDGAIVDGVSGSIKATVLDYSSSNPLAVRLTDTNGDYIVAGGGTQYAEGSTAATATGIVILIETGGNLFMPIQGNGSGQINISGVTRSLQAGTWTIDSITNALPAGNNNIGDVDVVSITTMAWPFNTPVNVSGNNLNLASQAWPFTGIVNVSGSNLNTNATQAGTWNIGTVTTLSNLTDITDQAYPFTTPANISGGNIYVTITGQSNSAIINVSGSNLNIASIAAGDNNIGNVDIVTMPSVTINTIPAGTNNIGTVNGSTVSITGGNIQYAEGSTAATATGNIILIETGGNLFIPIQGNSVGQIQISGVTRSLQSGTWDINSITTLPTVTINSIPAGTNNIGDVDVLTLPNVTIGAISNMSSPFTTAVNVSGSNLNLASQAYPFTSAANVSGGNLYVTITGQSNSTIVNVSGSNLNIASISAGDNNIGNVDIVTMPNVTIGSITSMAWPFTSALVNGSTVSVTGTGPAPLNVSGNNITINALPTSTNNIGTVNGSTVTITGSGPSPLNVSGSNITLNALPVGTNNIGTMNGSTVTVTGTGPAPLNISGIVGHYTDSPNFVNGTINVTTNAITAVITGLGSVRNYISTVSIANSSATSTVVALYDGTTLIWSTMAPASGGSNITFGTPLRLAVNSSLQASSLTAVTTLYVSANGYRAV